MRPLLCRIGLHLWKFHGPIMSGTGSIETCRCGLTRVHHWAGAYEYFTASGIEARQGGNAAGGAVHESPAPQGDAQ